MFDSTIGLAADIHGRITSCIQVSLSSAATTMSDFLLHSAASDETLQRYLDSVACDLQDSANAKADNYAQQRLLTRAYFRHKRKLAKESRKKSEEPHTSEKPKKKRKKHHQPS